MCNAHYLQLSSQRYMDPWISPLWNGFDLDVRDIALKFAVGVGRYRGQRSVCVSAAVYWLCMAALTKVSKLF